MSEAFEVNARTGAYILNHPNNNTCYLNELN